MGQQNGQNVLNFYEDDAENNVENDGLIFLIQEWKKATGQMKSRVWYLSLLWNIKHPGQQCPES